MSLTIAQNIEDIRERMARAAQAAGRNPADILLCAACKTRTVDEVKESARLEIDIFGENHVQELVEKTDADAYLGKPGHFIGHLQTNKIKKVLGRADLIQSVDSEHLLLALEAAAAKAGLRQDILLEVNIGGEVSKSGTSVDGLFHLLETAAEQPHIHVRGLMAIPPVNDDDTENRRQLARMRALFDKAADLRDDRISMDILSMGMSGDYENAILEGSTLVRIGTAIYGARDYSKK